MNDDQLVELLTDLIENKHESECLEFKVNNSNPQKIGEYISAISNSAALLGEPFGFIVWGIEDGTWKVVGTDFDPAKYKVKGEDLENFLVRQLDPGLNIQFYHFLYLDQMVTILQVPPAIQKPTSFKGTEFIRISSHKQALKKFPEKERALWKVFDQQKFEHLLVLSGLSSDQLLGILDYSSFFRVLKKDIPRERKDIIEQLKSEHLIIREPGKLYGITALGAILFAKDLNIFDILKRKTVRIVIYKGQQRTETIREFLVHEGYASGFEKIIGYVKDNLPAREVINGSFRQEVVPYPEITLRELIPNALIHQDLSIRGTGPMIEIFSDRIEITNPGKPLVNILRFIDTPPISRNEDLASFMRRINICEERGSGVDKVITAVECSQLPPPDFMVYENFTKSILYGPRKFSEMTKTERIRASYQHCCLCYVNNSRMTNTTLRVRFGLELTDISTISRIISDTVKKNFIKSEDPSSASRKHIKYVPFWVS